MKLKKALEVAVKLTPSKGYAPISIDKRHHDNVVISFVDTSGSIFELECENCSPGVLGFDGHVLIDKPSIKAILPLMNDESTIDIKDNWLHIDDYKFCEFFCESRHSFAKEATMTMEAHRGNNYAFDVNEIKQVIWAASSDESRFNLKGVLWDHTEQCLVGTDGHRLARYDDVDYGFEQSIIMPKPTLENIIKLALKSLGGMTLFTRADEPRYLCISFGETIRVYVELIVGNYPEHKRVMPKSFTAEATVLDIRRFQATLKSLNDRRKALNPRWYSINLDVNGSFKAYQTIKDTDRVEFDLGKHVRHSGEYDTSCNVEYLMDALSVLKVKSNSSILIRFPHDTRHPWEFTYSDSPKLKSILMPMNKPS